MDLLVVAAWTPELERFQELGGARAAAVGVGLVEAAAGTARLLARGPRPDAVVVLGTCGALPGSGLVAPDVVKVTTARVVDAAVLAGRADLPPPMPAAVDADRDLLARAPVRAVTALTTLGITTSDALAAELAPHGAIEHLEVFAVARACAAEGIPWAAVLGVANPVGESGRAAWRANHVAASARAAEVAHAAFVAARP